MNSRARDSQRSRVYRAEEEAFGFCVAPLLSFSECVDQVHLAFERYFPGSQVPLVADGRGRRRACGSPSRISIPRWSRRRWIVLHEIAHATIPPGAAWHGPEFAGCYLRLVRRFMGAEAAARLRAAYKSHRVKTRVR